MMSQSGTFCLVFSVVVLQGCVMPPMIEQNSPEYAPVIPDIHVPQGSNKGSLFHEARGVSLWNDQRARQVGDILTVLLEESTTSSKSSTSSVTKESSVDMGLPTLFGTNPRIDAPLIPSSSALSLASEIQADRESAGESQANQQNNLNGQISVTVTQVLPNGVLVIRGEKWLQLTEGQEFLRISGLVRPADVRQDNSVSSTRIADARITFSGTGQFAQAHQQGWLARFFNSIYWPY